jgi:hypothetical protein
MYPQEVLWLKFAAQALFEAADTEATTPRLHSCPCPYHITHHVKLGVLIDVLLNGVGRFEGFIQLGSG